MRPPALLSAAFVAGLALPVSAAPDDKETTERVSYSDRAERERAAEDPEGWIELADPSPASHRRMYITVDEEAGPYTRLKISADSGRPVIRRVRIDFADGTQRVVRVGKRLSKTSKPAYVDLRGPKQIERLVVDTVGPKRATYSVYAEHVRGTVATR